jgi:uroporphyrinogen decarboxylase
LEAAIQGELADRPPVALWRHFPGDDQDPLKLAEASLAFQGRYDFDFIKVTPASSYCIRDWGAEDLWEGDPEGTRTYVRRVIEDPRDWRSLQKLDPDKGSLGGQLKCLSHIDSKVGGEVPFIQTIFSPLAQAKNLAGGERLRRHLHAHPADVLAGLERITETTIAFVQAARERGIAGIFYAVQHASFDFFDRDGYARFGKPFDLRILDAAQGMWLNVLHLHGQSLIFDIAEAYPVHVVNWHDRETRPSLSEGKARLDAAVCGGLMRWDEIVIGNPARIQVQGRKALDSVNSQGVILGTGCVVPIVAPGVNLEAARQVVDFA